MPRLSLRAELAFPGKRSSPRYNQQGAGIEKSSYFVRRTGGYFQVPKRTFSSLDRVGEIESLLCIVPTASARGQQLLAAQNSCACVWTSVAAKLPIAGEEACGFSQASKAYGVCSQTPSASGQENALPDTAHSGSRHPEAVGTPTPLLCDCHPLHCRLSSEWVPACLAKDRCLVDIGLLNV